MDEYLGYFTDGSGFGPESDYRTLSAGGGCGCGVHEPMPVKDPERRYWTYSGDGHSHEFWREWHEKERRETISRRWDRWTSNSWLRRAPSDFKDWIAQTVPRLLRELGDGKGHGIKRPKKVLGPDEDISNYRWLD